MSNKTPTSESQTEPAKERLSEGEKAHTRNVASSSRLARILALGIGIRLFLSLAFPQFIGYILSERVELTTPVTSYKRLLEGLYLRRTGFSAYDGGVLHQSPIYLVLFLPLSYLPSVFTALFYAFTDALIALILAKVAGLKASSSTHSQRPLVPGEQLFVCSPNTVAALYLFNPLTLCTNLVKSTIVFSHLAIVLAMYFGIRGRANLAALSVAVGTHLSVYPAILVAPVALMARRRDEGNVASIVKTIMKMVSAFLAIHLALVLVYGSEYFGATFEFVLRVRDLEPNVGLFWYFFIEIFDEFRAFFIVVFQLTALAFAAPVTWRFRDDPLFGSVMLVGIISALKSYASWGDLSLFIALLPLYEELFKYMNYLFLSFNLIMFGISLAPIFWYVWIDQGSGNANFFYAATLVYVFGQITLLFDLGSAMLRRRIDRQYPEARVCPVIQI